MTTATSTEMFPIIDLQRFIQATRDSGYRSTACAVAELVDNAIQAGAASVDVVVRPTQDDAYPIEVLVRDDGSGMDPDTLRLALRFGGSTRFNDRKGLGRYGMGLPNSSLSQARRLTVYTWLAPSKVHSTHLDVDEIASGECMTIPAPEVVPFPLEGRAGAHGTVVRWERCDRLDHRRIGTIERKLLAALGRQFRHFLLAGFKIRINGEAVEPIDPLYLATKATFSGARPFGSPLRLEVRIDPTNGNPATSTVKVIFSELPVHEWHAFSNEEKRRRGISKGAGISVVRAGREVDYGWFFLGKRRENYDDWWRCEVLFEPELDEAFGITHTKQQVRPRAYLVEALAPEIEATAKALNARVRQAHLSLKAAERASVAETRARERDALLPAVPPGRPPDGQDDDVLADLHRRHPGLGQSAPRPDGTLDYRIVEDALPDTVFFRPVREDGRLLLVLNPEHPFYKQVYKPLLTDDVPLASDLRTKIELLLLAAARSEAAEDTQEARAVIERQRSRWSSTLAAFLSR